MKITRNALWALSLVLFSCGNTPKEQKEETNADRSPAVMAEILEESLFNYILDIWYPLNIDKENGGYISGFERDWTLSRRQEKSLVQQARHTWTTGFVLEHYPQKTEYLEYSRQGFEFLRDKMWDQEYGGFFSGTQADGTPVFRGDDGKLSYGQSFAIYGLSQYYKVSKDEEALELAIKSFNWMEEHVHDKQYGGYPQFLERDGTPIPDPGEGVDLHSGPGMGLKDYNSSIHIMEGFTNLYSVWPDELLRTRLEEMFYLIRDTFVHPEGYLQLYFYPDWTLVPDENMIKRSGNAYHSQHITYGHDVETSFLLLETAHVLGVLDKETHIIAKRIVDRSLANGWDSEKGGFMNMGKIKDGKEEIISNQKPWWVEVEGLNALLLMHTLYPDDPNDYYGYFLKIWDYIDQYLIDKEFGGWYNSGLDTSPENVSQGKSHGWKTTYHNTRGMVHCVEMLKSL